jgi:hypothetical protein
MKKKYFLKAILLRKGIFLIICMVSLLNLSPDNLLAEKYIVTNNATSGDGSLYKAIEDANSNQGLDTILFDVNVRDTINTSSCLPKIIESLVIIGPGADVLTLDSDFGCRVIETDDFYADSLFIYGLTLTRGGGVSGAGAGLFLDGGTNYFYKCKITRNDNTYQNIAGGGIYMFGGLTYFYNCEISNNKSYIGGSGIASAASAKVFIYNCGINNNSTYSSGGEAGGGGIYNAGKMHIENSTISGNSHPSRGGGIYNLLANRTVHLNHATISDNSASYGGGIYNRDKDENGRDTIWLKNTIVANNSATSEGNDLWGNYISEDYNLVENPAGANISGNTANNIYQTNPTLNSLGYYSYYTQHQPLASGSAAIDQANESDYLPLDQLGKKRPKDGDNNGSSLPDIGAVEFMEDADNDGISDTEEQGIDGNSSDYDGNNDGNADKNQNNVASFKTYDGSYYITIASPENTSINQVTVTQGDNSQAKKRTQTYDLGLISFKVESLQQPSSTEVMLYLPDGVTANGYTNFGPTPDKLYPHSYSFEYEGATGAEFNEGQIILHFADGEKGDHDLTENNTLVIHGGPIIGEAQNMIVSEFKSVKTYPNPFSSSIYFQLPQENSKSIHLMIYDMQGREVICQRYDNSDNSLIEVDGSSLNEGIYIYKIRSESFVYHGKLLKLKTLQ